MERNLQAIESAFVYLGRIDWELAENFAQRVIEIVGIAEVDLGFEWREGKFYPVGARSLDEKLVNDHLQWLRQGNAANVIEPFEKGLNDFLFRKGDPKRLSDVITDMYEALEARAKNVVRNDKDLSANREAFISRVKASDAYKKLLQRYIAYANDFRHAAEQGQAKPRVTEREVESFMYLTGVFIRLAMPDE